MNKYIYILACLVFGIWLTGCMKPTGETIVLPVKNGTIPERVLTLAEQDSLLQYMPIYEGSEPPDVTGHWLASPMELKYASDGFAGLFYDMHWCVEHQNGRNIASYKEWQSSAAAVGKEAHVIGDGNNFTMYTIEQSEDASRGWSCEVVTIVSGIKDATGIKDFHYAIVMRDKRDEQGIIIEPDSYRVFTDGDGVSLPITNVK